MSSQEDIQDGTGTNTSSEDNTGALSYEDVESSAEDGSRRQYQTSQEDVGEDEEEEEIFVSNGVPVHPQDQPDHPQRRAAKDQRDPQIYYNHRGESGCEEEEEGEVFFNEYLAIIESIVLSDEFCDSQEEFFLSHCDKFSEVGGSNPGCSSTASADAFSHDCITVFQQYCLWVEGVIEAEVQRRRVSLNIGQFISLLQGQISQLQGEVFDTLYSMADFSHFQNTMQQYRRLKSLQPGASRRSRSPKSPRTGPGKGPGRSASSSCVPYEKLNDCMTVTGYNNGPGTNYNDSTNYDDHVVANHPANWSAPGNHAHSPHRSLSLLKNSSKALGSTASAKCEKLMKGAGEKLAKTGAAMRYNCRMLKSSQSFDTGAFRYQNGFRDRSLDEIHNTVTTSSSNSTAQYHELTTTDSHDLTK